MKLHNIFLSTLFLSSMSLTKINTSAPSQTPISDKMPILQLPAALCFSAVPTQLPERIDPVTATPDRRHHLSQQEKEDLINMLAQMQLTQ